MAIIDRRGIVVDDSPSSAGSFIPSANLAIKTPCRVATTANITLSGLQTIDSVAVVADDRVLVKNQSSAVDNGIYKVSSGNWERTTDFDSPYETVKGTQVLINEGTVEAGHVYVVTSSNPLVPGTSSLTFAISTAYQASDADLTALAGLTSAANKIPYFTGPGAAALADFPATARTLLTTPSSANLRSFLSDETGTGAAVFGTSPTIATPTITSPTITTPTITTPNIVGVTDGSSAAVGSVGELLTAEVTFAGRQSITTATAAVVTTISAPAGDYDGSATAGFETSGGGVASEYHIEISTTNIPTIVTAPNAGGTAGTHNTYIANQGQAFPTGTRQFLLSGTTTCYLKVYSTFTNSQTAYGFFRMRRMR